LKFVTQPFQAGAVGAFDADRSIPAKSLRRDPSSPCRAHRQHRDGWYGRTDAAPVAAPLLTCGEILWPQRGRLGELDLPSVPATNTPSSDPVQRGAVALAHSSSETGLLMATQSRLYFL